MRRYADIIVFFLLGFFTIAMTAYIYFNNLYSNPIDKLKLPLLSLVFVFVISFVIYLKQTGTSFFSKVTLLKVLLPYFSGIIISTLVMLFVIRWEPKAKKITRAADKPPTEKELAWWGEAKSIKFQSDDGEFSFNYISENYYGTKVLVKEEGDIVQLSFDDNTQTYLGGVKLMANNSGKKLEEYLTEKYPGCRFYEVPRRWGKVKLEESLRFIDYGKDYKVANSKCPEFEIEVKEGASPQKFILEDTRFPNRFLIVAHSDFPPLSGPPSHEDKYPRKWFETIEILKK